MSRGLVNVIGLEAIEARAGARWPKLRYGVHSRLDSMLRQKLGPEDFFMPLNDGAFLVATPMMEPYEAQSICLRISYELHTEYLGPVDISTLRIYCVRPAENNALTLDILSSEQLFIATERAGLADAIGRLRKAHVPRGVELADPEFHPLWDTRKEAIAGYFCAPRENERRDPNAPPLTGKERQMVELATLYNGVTKLADRLERQERFLMAFGLDFDNLGSAMGRMEFVAVCRELPSEFRPYIIFVLTGIPSGVPQSRLSDLLITVKPFCKAAFAEAACETRIFAAYSNIGLQGLGYSMTRETAGSNVSADIHRISTNARRVNLTTFLTGVNSRSTLYAARDAGINMLAGSAIAAPLDMPVALKRLTWQQVMATPLAAAG